MPKLKYHQEDWQRWPRIDGVWYIYGLHLNGSDEIRYIGSTVDVQHRYEQHLQNPTKSIKGWVTDNRMAIRIKVLAQVQDDHLGQERRFAQEYHAKGHRILNDRQPRRSTKKEREDSVKAWLRRLGM